MDANPLRLSMVVPAFNESAVIETAVREADDALGRLFVEFEVIVVDDGSRDGTGEIVERLTGKYPRLRLVRHQVNRGYGAALRSGFEAAAFGLVAFTDADCQFDLLDLGRMVPLTDRYPVVTGYRADRQDPWRRRFLSWGYNRLARSLLGTGVRDCDCALKVFRREALADLMPESRGFFVNSEMLARARRRGHAVAEVAVAHRPRLGGASKVSLGEVPRTLRTLLSFWWREVAFGSPGPVASVVWAARVATGSRPGRGPVPAAGVPRLAGQRAGRWT